ncbi:MAG: dienelactone hydrolase family protein [Gemmataceae bacterium]
MQATTLGALSLDTLSGDEQRISGGEPAVPSSGTPIVSEAQVGSLYPFVQKTAEHSTLELSFLRDRFRNIETWKREARLKVRELLRYKPPSCAQKAEVVESVDCGNYLREKIYFNTTPDIRVPAYLVLPKGEKKRRPAIVALHDHGGFYVWGKEKVVALDKEHRSLTEFKRQYYAGRSYADELARRGYVVIVIDMFYWGERWMRLADDPPAWREPPKMSSDDVTAFNRRSSTSTALLATALFEAGVTWSGVMFHDDIRTVDYLITRPEVDPDRIGCCGLSVGGFRSAWLAGLDARIKAAVVIGWMSTAGEMLKSKLTSIGLWKTVPGLYHYMDLPDVVSMTAPGALMVIHGTKDKLFTNEGVNAAFDKIAKVFKKAGAPDRFEGVTYDGPHEFNAEMQAKAFACLDRWLKP